MCLNVRNLLYPRLSSIAVAAFIISAPVTSSGQQAQTAPIHIQITEAIQRAQANEPIFAASVAAQKTEGINSYLAKAALLPTATYHNQMLLHAAQRDDEQGWRSGQSVAADLYREQCHSRVHQSGLPSTRRRIEASCRCEGRFRDCGPCLGGVGDSSAWLGFQRRRPVLPGRGCGDQTASFRAGPSGSDDFIQDLTQKREAAREVAHADVIKAQLQQQQRQRDLSDADVAADKARLELASSSLSGSANGLRNRRARHRAALPARDEVRPPRFHQKPGDSERPGGVRAATPACFRKSGLSAGSGAQLQLRHRRSAVCKHGPGRCEQPWLLHQRHAGYSCVGLVLDAENESSRARSSAM